MARPKNTSINDYYDVSALPSEPDDVVVENKPKITRGMEISAMLREKINGNEVERLKKQLREAKATIASLTR